ncbi:MAG: hypothetical protein WC722_05755 [Rhodospirillales bacterium]|jgi:hypothetical protein
MMPALNCEKVTTAVDERGLAINITFRLTTLQERVIAAWVDAFVSAKGFPSPKQIQQAAFRASGLKREGQFCTFSEQLQFLGLLDAWGRPQQPALDYFRSQASQQAAA